MFAMPSAFDMNEIADSFWRMMFNYLQLSPYIRGHRMRRISFVLAAVIALAGVVVHMAPAAEGAAAPIFGITIPAGYRDWKLISVAHEAGNLNDIRAILGNDKAIEADTRCPRLRWLHSCLAFRSRRNRRLVVLAVLPGAVQRGFLVILKAVVALRLGLLATLPLRPGRL